MNSLWPSRTASDGAESPESADNPAETPAENPAETAGITEVVQGQVDVTDTVGVADVGPILEGAAPKPKANPPPMRPGLQRNQIQPNATVPLPPPAGNQSNQPPDSLSLAQLRRIVSEIRSTEAVAYDFVYSDTGPHAEEIDEWFVYQWWQCVRLNKARKAFEEQWELHVGAPISQVTWEEASAEARSRFVQQALDGVLSNEATIRVDSIGSLVYIALGRWADTAEQPQPHLDKSKVRTVASQDQLAAIKSGVKLIAEVGGVPTVWRALCDVYEALR